jgi:hypothetical protein
MRHVVLVQILVLIETGNAALSGLTALDRDKDHDHKKGGDPPQAHSVRLLSKGRKPACALAVLMNNGCTWLIQLRRR